MPTLQNKEELLLVEVRVDAKGFKIRTAPRKEDGEYLWAAYSGSDPWWYGIKKLKGGEKILGTLESGIFKGDRMLSDEQRAALKSADPDKKYVILLITNHK